MPELYINKQTASHSSKEAAKGDHHTNEKNHLEKEHHLVQVPHTHHYNPISSYCHFPANVKFSSADSDEKIILLLRKHWLTNVKWFITGVVMLIVPLPFVYFPILNFVPERFIVVGVLFWYLATAAFTLEKFLSWFFNVYIVTDERVFDVDFYDLVHRDISDANLDQIQDVTSRIGGSIRTSFNYGDVLIQTAAESLEIEFEAVPKPDEVASILRKLRVEEEQEKLEGRVR